MERGITVAYTICKNINDIPKEPHFAIITFVSVDIPGDERSRTNPGHGYPATTEYYTQYFAFPSNCRDIWELQIREMTARKLPFVPIVATPAVVQTSITVTVKEGK